MNMRRRTLLRLGVSGSLCALWVGGAVLAPTAWATTQRHHGGGGGSTASVTANNPGSQTSGTTQSVSLQIHASDTNSGALSYSSAGLPAGLSINGSTGLITGTLLAAGQSSVQVTVIDTVGGASARTTFAWTVNGAYDVSYPQCGTTLPTAAGVSIVGVNDGIVLSTNPCLASQAGWANGHGLQFYANTGDPGPAYSSHWPTAGQAAPQSCTTTSQNSTACSYDYGYNAARDSFQRAVSALTNSSINPAAVTWWLDVETGNSWQTLESAYGQSAPYQANDVSALQGEAGGLQSEGVTTVGIYSTGYQWTEITGGTGSSFVSNPAWLAGYSSESSAQTACSASSFTGGRVTYTQYPSGSFDADYPC